MSTRVEGFIPPNDPLYKKHAAVLKACLEAEIEELPKETAEYFETKYPDPCLFEEKLTVELPIKDWSDESSEGFELFVKDIPAGVEKIRFSNSW